MLFRLSKGKLFYSIFKLESEKYQNQQYEDSYEELLNISLDNFISKYIEERSFCLENFCKDIFNNIQNKNGILILLPSFQKEYLNDKIETLLKANESDVFEFPRNGNQMKILLENIKEEIEDVINVYISSKMNLENNLKSFKQKFEETGLSNYMTTKAEILVLRSLLFHLNKCSIRNNLLEIKVWIPSSQNSNFNLIVESINRENSNEAIEFHKENIKIHNPPSYSPEHNFLNQFQEIVNTYGIPSYKEINPAVFTAVTFPFLFGVMFGDIAHGSALFLFSLYILFNSESLANKFKTKRLMFKSLGYTLAFMGFFSVYAGLIYNDFLALPVTFKDTCYQMGQHSYGNI